MEEKSIFVKMRLTYKKWLACFKKCKQMNLFSGSFYRLALKLNYRVEVSISSRLFFQLLQGNREIQIVEFDG